MLRFYEPSEGQILLDGVDIRYINLKNLRNIFGVVGQEPFLFNESIEYNIRYNKYELNFKQIEEGAKKAAAYDFITKTDYMNNVYEIDEQGNPVDDLSGFSRFVGNKGSQLSGGQKQRVAIARAIVRQPMIYLFDEATSALDTETEKEVNKSLEEIAKEKTTICIAHRLNTVKNCDLIYVIDGKKVAESGTFDELCKKAAIFWNLMNLQKDEA